MRSTADAAEWLLAVRSRSTSAIDDHLVCMAPWLQARNTMLLFLTSAVLLIALPILRRIHVPGGVNSSSLGWMSERWLAEYRASGSR